MVNYASVPCNVSTESVSYFRVSIAWALQKDSPLRPLFNFYLTKAKESGEINRLMTRYVPSKVCYDSGFKPIAFQSIFTAFVMLSIGIALAMISSFVEKLHAIRDASEKSGKPKDKELGKIKSY